ncbi:MAG: hypothetical protein K0R93_682 [Anaerosolibacter sp.]|jgi:hypothetical protein|uniref:Shedu anti-phage system protein SduA domain-containing protein n=1 Tax=Anaerosolibacter sp. TaxID=1872527 RepID=UPI00260CCA3A|nr:Shedu anti-phage system protein SduA domain-containing protein [Anaerosolibacter sp.]MDF2545784.1 hypothetical protein [Anaerosolibacter sp.]
MDYLKNLIKRMNELADHNNAKSIDDLIKLLVNREDRYSDDKHIIPVYASRLLLIYKCDGIEVLAKLFGNLEGPIYNNAVLNTIYYASRKEYTYIPFMETPFLPQPVQEKIRKMNMLYDLKYPEITDEMAELSRRKFTDIVLQVKSDYNIFNYFSHFIYMNNIYSVDERFSKDIFNSFREATLQINSRVIQDFKSLLDKNEREESYQTYLGKFPVMLEPLAKEVLTKQKLGLEYITDFVIRKYDNTYIIVEIEKPSTRIFNKNNDFSSEFTHALGQVIDFQEWIESNIAYANRIMPDIITPEGMLIIGRSDNLTNQQIRKLNRLNVNLRGKIKILTFNDILDNAIKLYENIIS